MIGYWIALGIIIIAFFYDVTTFKIPNWLCLTSLSMGLILNVYEAGWIGFLTAIIAMGVGFIPMLCIYLLKGIGAGDVKLFASLAPLIGIQAIVELMILSFLVGGVISIILLGYYGMRKLKQKLKFVYSPYIIEVPSGQTLGRFGIATVHQFPFMLAVAPALFVQFILFIP